MNLIQFHGIQLVSYVSVQPTCIQLLILFPVMFFYLIFNSFKGVLIWTVALY